MRRLSRDEDAMDAVIGVILIVAIVVVLVAGVFVFAMGFKDNVQTQSIVFGLVTEGADQRADQWTIKIQSHSRESVPADYNWVLRTPDNGTLVARPSGAFLTSMDHYWQLGGSAGTGVHFDNGTTVGANGLGGFHLRLADTNANGLLDVGDKVSYWYDGDGDQQHQATRDDVLPGGAYTFELIHKASDSMSGTIVRDM